MDNAVNKYGYPSPCAYQVEQCVDLDMVGTGYAVDAFGEVMVEGGADLWK